MIENLYQMNDECFIYQISPTYKPNYHQLTNYCHYSDPTPQMHISTKQICTVYCFSIDTCLMMHSITEIGTDGKYQSFHLIPNLCGWVCYLCNNFVMKPLWNSPKNMISGPLLMQSLVGCSIGRPIMRPFHGSTNLYFSANLQPWNKNR